VNPETLRIALVFALLGLVLLRNLRGFVRFLFPGAVRYRILGRDGEVMDPAVRLMGRELAELGFVPVGRVAQRRPLSSDVEQSIYANEAKGDWAVVFPRGRDAWLYFLTEPRPGTFVLTADHSFPSSQRGAFRTGGLPNAAPRDVYAAHRRVVETEDGAPSARSLEAFVDLGRRFFARGPGAGAVRRRSMREFLFASAALLWGVLTLWQLLMRR